MLKKVHLKLEMIKTIELAFMFIVRLMYDRVIRGRWSGAQKV